MSAVEARILLVEDEPAHRELIARALQASEFACRVTAVDSLRTARERFDAAQEPFDLALVDLQLPDGNGIELLQGERKLAGVPVVVMTSHGSEEVAVEALKLGACDYLVKSADRLGSIGQVVQRVLREQQHIRDQQAAEVALAQSHGILSGLIDSLKSRIAVLDEHGDVVMANRLWKAPSRRNPLAADANEVGQNYLRYCSSLAAETSQDAQAVMDGIRSVMDGERPHFRHEYEVPAPQGSYWFETTASKFNGNAPARVVVAHEDVTLRKQQELDVQRRAIARAKLSLLSRREREVLDLVVAGHPNKAIAKRLELSDKTVEKHRANVMKKLNLQNVAELVRLAMQAEGS